MTFRTKLMQAILGVVIVTTAATLWIAQRQNSASYGAVVDELFRDQALAFRREHEVRLEAAAQEAERLAASVRLFAALEENDPEVYKIASDELRLGEFTFFRLRNAHGELIPPPGDGHSGVLDLAVRDYSCLRIPAGRATYNSASSKWRGRGRAPRLSDSCNADRQLRCACRHADSWPTCESAGHVRRQVRRPVYIPSGWRGDRQERRMAGRRRDLALDQPPGPRLRVSAIFVPTASPIGISCSC
jgi:hypothetical protein